MWALTRVLCPMLAGGGQVTRAPSASRATLQSPVGPQPHLSEPDLSGWAVGTKKAVQPGQRHPPTVCWPFLPPQDPMPSLVGTPVCHPGTVPPTPCTIVCGATPAARPPPPVGSSPSKLIEPTPPAQGATWSRWI